MNLFQGLYKYRLKKRYDVAKSRRDHRLNLGRDYSEDLIQKMTSNHIMRSDTMRTFSLFINDFIYQILGPIKTLNIWKNYTVKKDDRHTR